MDPEPKTTRRRVPNVRSTITLFLTIMSPMRVEAVEDFSLISQGLAQSGELGKQFHSSTGTSMLSSSIALGGRPSEQASKTDEDLLTLRLGPGSRSGSQETLTSVPKSPLTGADSTDHQRLVPDFQHPKTDTTGISLLGKKLQVQHLEPVVGRQHMELSGNPGSTSLGSPSKTTDQAKGPSDSASVYAAAHSPKHEALSLFKEDKDSSQSWLRQTQDPGLKSRTESLKASKRPILSFPWRVDSDYVDAEAKNIQRGHARPRIFKRPVEQPGPFGSIDQAGPIAQANQPGSSESAVQQLQSKHVVNPTRATPKSTLSDPKGSAKALPTQSKRYEALRAEFDQQQLSKTAHDTELQDPHLGKDIREAVKTTDLDATGGLSTRYRSLVLEHGKEKNSKSKEVLSPVPGMKPPREPVEVADLNNMATRSSHAQRQLVKPIKSGGPSGQDMHSWQSYLAASRKAHQEMYPNKDISKNILLHQQEIRNGLPSQRIPKRKSTFTNTNYQFPRGAYYVQEHDPSAKMRKIRVPIQQMADPNAIRTAAINIRREHVRPINR